MDSSSSLESPKNANTFAGCLFRLISDENEREIIYHIGIHIRTKFSATLRSTWPSSLHLFLSAHSAYSSPPTHSPSPMHATSVGLLLTMVVSPAATTQSWRMLGQYLNHHVSHKLKPSGSITVDGKFDEPAWLAAETMQHMMVDSTRHSNQQPNAIPMDLQANIKG